MNSTSNDDPKSAGKMPVQDSLGRPLRDLRISVTDRCNFRCTYCMPACSFPTDHRFTSHAEILRYEEIVRIVRAALPLGVEKLRITGGEPLLRKGLSDLVAMLREVADGCDIALTTNGALLQQHAPALRDAGLDRVTVSLDALDDAVFRQMSGSKTPVAQVLKGIDAALAAGLGPVKVNVVVQRGVNDSEVVPLARHFRGTGVDLRFIEFMDVGTRNGWSPDDVVPSRELLARLSEHWELVPRAARYDGEVAARHTYADGQGEVGFITSITQPFCTGCTRLRISADGRLYTCLFASEGRDLKTPLRENASQATLESMMRAVWEGRDDRYSELRAAQSDLREKVEMYQVGG